MASMADQDGQPPRMFYQARLDERLVHEMLGFCRGIIADGVVVQSEVDALARYLQAYPDCVASFTGRALAERLQAIFADGEVSAEEREELRWWLENTVPQSEVVDGDVRPVPTRIAYDDPLPTVFFESHTFVLTGRFLYGTRERCERAIADRGGRCHPRVTSRISCLVVGTVASDAWIQGGYGWKIEEAVALRDAGWKVAIVPEAHWADALSVDA